MVLDRPVPWAVIYSKAVDKLLRDGLITWKYKDERGAFYSTIIVTEKGITAYKNHSWPSQE